MSYELLLSINRRAIEKPNQIHTYITEIRLVYVHNENLFKHRWFFSRNRFEENLCNCVIMPHKLTSIKTMPWSNWLYCWLSPLYTEIQWLQLLYCFVLFLIRECSSPCAGNSMMTCGGVDRIQVFGPPPGTPVVVHAGVQQKCEPWCLTSRDSVVRKQKKSEKKFVSFLITCRPSSVCPSVSLSCCLSIC